MGDSRDSKEDKEEKLVRETRVTQINQYYTESFCPIGPDRTACTYYDLTKDTIFIDILNTRTDTVEKTLKEVNVLEYPPGKLCIVFDGEYLVSGFNRQLKRWNPATEESEVIFTSTTEKTIADLICLSPDEFICLITDNVLESAVELWNTKNQQREHLFDCNSGAFDSIIFRNNHIINLTDYGDYTGNLSIYNFKTKKLVQHPIESRALSLIEGRSLSVDATDDYIAIGLYGKKQQLIRCIDYSGKVFKTIPLCEYKRAEDIVSQVQVCALPTDEFFCALFHEKNPTTYRVNPKLDSPVLQEEKELSNDNIRKLVLVSICLNPYNGYVQGLGVNKDKKSIIFSFNIGLKERFEEILRDSEFGKKMPVVLPPFVMEYLGFFKNSPTSTATQSIMPVEKHKSKRKR